MVGRTAIFGIKAKILCVLVAVVLCSFSTGLADTIVRFDTVMGNFHVQLSDTVTPLTVQNFLNYVNDGDYVNSFFHRLASSFVLQGGGYTYEGGDTTPSIPTDPPVLNEYNISNTYGTIAMAKVGPPDNLDGTPGTPTEESINSATSQFFFNLGDNSENLDNQNGGFTVFGEVIGNGMDVVNELAAQPDYGSGNLPLLSSYDPEGTDDWREYLEMIYGVTVVLQGDANGDGVVSAGDYATVQANMGATGDVGIPGDTNYDGVVDEADYVATTGNFGNIGNGVVSAGDYASVQSNFGNTGGDTTVIPEPATMGLLLIGGIALLKRKRK